MDYARHNEWVSALRRNALRFVLIVGTANLFADLTYEGARSVNGQFLATLGASAAVVGFTAGFGELLGYGLRSIAGLVADRTGRYWLAAIAGYIINMAAVPALALAGNWQLAAVLIITERTGRAIRKPAMATMLSHAGQRIGHGWVFGLNEALDQAGATIGPLMMALVLFLRGGYRQGYAVLVIPAVITVGTIVAARHFFPQPRDLEAGHPLEGRGLSRRYWLYLVAAGCIGAGFADFALIGYHFEKTHVVAQTLIPLYYAVAMGVGAIGALILGRLFDINQARTIFGAVIVAALFAPLVFLGGSAAALLGMILWGIGMALTESVLLSLVAGIVEPARRATAFGLFDTGFGVAWFAGSALMGILYQISIPSLVIFSVLAHLMALVFFALAGFGPGGKADSAPDA
ncbi:MAG: MFS transporter [Chloroflexi bacterium]|nr:MAG: MFS transporter [Chloroflexota bacterium]